MSPFFQFGDPSSKRETFVRESLPSRIAPRAVLRGFLRAKSLPSLSRVGISNSRISLAWTAPASSQKSEARQRGRMPIWGNFQTRPDEAGRPGRCQRNHPPARPRGRCGAGRRRRRRRDCRPGNGRSRAARPGFPSPSRADACGKCFSHRARGHGQIPRRAARRAPPPAAGQPATDRDRKISSAPFSRPRPAAPNRATSPPRGRIRSGSSWRASGTTCRS